MKTKKILHLCNYIQPKLGYQEYFLAKEHAKLGYEVTVVTSDRYFPFPDYKNTVQNVLGDRIIGVGVENIEGFKIERLGVFFEIGTQTWLKGLKKKIKEINPDIVICHGMNQINSQRVAKYKKRMKFKLIYDNHGLFISDSKNPLLNLYYKFFFNFMKIEYAADKLIGVADECVSYVVEKFKIPADRVEMIPLGADTERFYYNDIHRKEIRKKYLIEDDNMVIIYTGKIIKSKGIDLMINAISSIKRFEKIVLFVIGSGKAQYKDYLKRLAEEKGVKLILKNAINNNELSQYYSAADVGAWPTSATNGTLEGMACSLPIICNKILTERYEAGNGFGVDDGNIKEQKEYINFFLEYPDKRKEMGEKSKKVIDEYFSWKIIAKKFITGV